MSTSGQQGTSTPTPKPTVPAGTTATVTPDVTPTAQSTPTSLPRDGERFFPETGFTVPAVFLKHWDANGGLPVFGFPISEARTEKNLTDGKEYLVQYFERNRFEHHPEFAGTNNEVLLGLLGAELTRGRVFSEAEAFED